MGHISLQDIWCSLNSSFGGPFLAIVTFGGFLALGRSLVNFPPSFTTKDFVWREGKNQRRRLVMALGIITAVLLVGNILAYMNAFSANRAVAASCLSVPISPDGRCALLFFYASSLLSAVSGTIYAFLLGSLNRVQR